MNLDYLNELQSCNLCEHRCGVNRLDGETGVCGMLEPVVASATLHPAPPESYTVFMAGCNFKCLNCQNWTIAQNLDHRVALRGFIPPQVLARMCVEKLESTSGRQMGADRIFFSGGEPTVHLPFIEKVVEEARRIKPDIKVNFDTNGYLTQQSLNRVLEFTTSITYDLKAYHEHAHRALTGASAHPVLRNAEYIGRYARDKIWEYRILVVPGINTEELTALTKFMADIDCSLPVCFLAFRPNFVLDYHPGATRDMMNQCVETAKDNGLINSYWSGFTGIGGEAIRSKVDITTKYKTAGAALAGTYASSAGCHTHPRDCLNCTYNQDCNIQHHVPGRST
jgi:pyruvate formate lyase activating enzyme